MISTSKSDKIATNNYTSERTKRSAAYDQLQDKQLHDVVVHLNTVTIPEITRVANSYRQLERAMNLKFDQQIKILQQLEKFQIKIKSDLEVRVYDLQNKNGILEKSLRATKDESHNILMTHKKILTENEKLRSEMKSKTEALQLENDKLINKIRVLERSSENMSDKLDQIMMKSEKQEGVTDKTIKSIDLQIRTLNQTFLISTQQNNQKWKMQMKIDEGYRSNLRLIKSENQELNSKFLSIDTWVKSASQEILNLENLIFRHDAQIQQLNQSFESSRNNVETKIQNLKSTQDNAFTDAQQLQSEIYQLRITNDGEARKLWNQLDMVNSKSNSLQNSMNQMLEVSQCTTQTLTQLVGAIGSL